jgi:signal transduction histidine kinase
MIDILMERLFGVSIPQSQQELGTAKLLVAQANTFLQKQEASRQQKRLHDGNLQQQFKAIFDNKEIAISFYDKDGYLIDLNDRMREICGFDAEGERFFRQTRMFDVPVFHDLDPSRRDAFYTCQHMQYPELGINRYIEVRVQPNFDANGQLAYYTFTTRDVSERRRRLLEQRDQEEELQRTNEEISRYEQELNYLLKQSNMYVWSLDFARREITFSRSLKKPDYAISAEAYLDSLYDEYKQRSTKLLMEQIDNPHELHDLYHFKYTPASKVPRWHTIDGVPLLDEEGHTVGLFGLLRDVSDQMEIQQQLRQEQTRAEASGVMKSAFLANMSHEIRTPLNAIVGFSDLLQVVDEPAERQEFIRIIRNNCDMLLRLINDILEASDTGQALAIEPTDIDFSQVFDDICQTLEQRVQEPGVSFVKENPYASLPTTLDKGRLQQIITNFVTNAVKYTHQGHIRVGYLKTPVSQDTLDGLIAQNPLSTQSTRNVPLSDFTASGLFIFCEDTGAGIPKDKQESVFDRFVKLNDHVKGTGLGLSICKSIVERCGGTIGVTSEGDSQGSTFWVWLPCEERS